MKDDITCVFEGVAGVGGIYISNLKAAQNTQLLAKLGIKAIVTAVRNGIVRHDKEDITDHLYVPADDVPHFDLSKYFEETFQFIDTVRRRCNVLVHCYAGISRSATIVIAYLLRKYNYSLDNVITMVKRRRSKINPNKGFIEQLKQQAARMGIPSSEKQETAMDKILKGNKSMTLTSPKKKRAISSYTGRIKMNPDPIENSVHNKNLEVNPYPYSQNQEEKNQQNRFSQSTQLFHNQDQNVEEKTKEHDIKMDLYQSLQLKKETLDVPIKKEKSFYEKKSRYSHKSELVSQPLQESKFMNPKMAEKIQKFKSKILMEQQKRKKRSTSDFRLIENISTFKSVTPRAGQKYRHILSKKLSMNVEIEGPVPTKNDPAHFKTVGSHLSSLAKY